MRLLLVRRHSDALGDELLIRASPGGHAGVVEFWETWLGTMDDFELEVTECTEAPGDRVFVTTQARGKGKGSGAPVEGELHQVFEYEAGAVVRVKLFGSRSAALGAAGLG